MYSSADHEHISKTDLHRKRAVSYENAKECVCEREREGGKGRETDREREREGVMLLKVATPHRTTPLRPIPQVREGHTHTHLGPLVLLWLGHPADSPVVPEPPTNMLREENRVRKSDTAVACESSRTVFPCPGHRRLPASAVALT